MDQIWLASPSPALRLWPGRGGATWRLNPAAVAWGRAQQGSESTWRAVADAISTALASGSEREGLLVEPPLRWRSLPMSTGWLIWLLPEPAGAATVERASQAGPADPGIGAGSVGAETVEHDRDAALTRRIDFIADAADAAGAGIWLHDPQTGAVEWNRQMFVLHGLSPEVAPPGLAAYADHVVHPVDRDAFRAAQQAALDARAPLDAEFRVLQPDGSVRWIDYRSRHDDRGGRAVLAGIALDATDRIGQRDGGERMPRQRGVVERPSTARSEFLARMSHELRTPLNAVLGFAQLIEHDGKSVPAHVQLERVVHIREAGQQLLRLIGDVLEHLKRDVPAEAPPDPRAAPADDVAVDAAASARALSVLYIEDNPVNVLLVEELVAMRPKTHLCCAVTGMAGVAAAVAHTPDVVLVDMQLPDIDGFEVLRRLRADRALDRSAVIALSANGMGDDIALALAAGFDDYWTKPIDFRHFLSGLDALAQSR